MDSKTLLSIHGLSLTNVNGTRERLNITAEERMSYRTIAGYILNKEKVDVWNWCLRICTSILLIASHTCIVYRINQNKVY